MTGEDCNSLFQSKDHVNKQEQWARSPLRVKCDSIKYVHQPHKTTFSNNSSSNPRINHNTNILKMSLVGFHVTRSETTGWRWEQAVQELLKPIYVST